MSNSSGFTYEQLKYVHQEVLFFSIEHNEEYIHFYRDGTHVITNPEDKLLADLYRQFKNDDFPEAFYLLKNRTEMLKNSFKGLFFHHDVILFNGVDDD